jgi:CheY-like chemotaxis protein
MSLPIYQHPSAAVLVDDSASFLHGLARRLDPMLPRIAFHDPYSALDWIRQGSLDAIRPEALLSATYDTYPRLFEQSAICVDVEQIRHISCHAGRFMLPSVIVVDYEMQQMSGVEFCEALRDLPCKKILLTGPADEGAAIDAFNRGLIHRCIRKSSDDSLARLGADIQALQREYFQGQSDTLKGFLALHEHGFVTDPAIGELLADICKRYYIVEHYLHANPAGVLMYDGQGNARLLVIQSENTMNAHYEVARDNEAPASLLAAIAERQVIPHFHDGDGMYSPAVGESWHKYAQAAQRCRGRELYYWTIFDLPSDATSQKMISFESFMHEHRAV